MLEITKAALADGREIIYFDDTPHTDRVLEDSRELRRSHRPRRCAATR